MVAGRMAQAAGRIADAMNAQRHDVPISATSRAVLFAEWCRRNPGPLAEIDHWALELYRHGRVVSTKYLVEKQRYEGVERAEGVPFVDQHGRVHCYAINNNDTPLLARRLLDKYPRMDVRTRRTSYESAEG